MVHVHVHDIGQRRPKKSVDRYRKLIVEVQKACGVRGSAEGVDMDSLTS